ncbi:hypothetical protein ACFC25_04420 [Pseudarthrobacter sp. NPDC055928]|uniref:hypothetical protein n=1 Tax=Pseudarthrobacter sp. NPDC055928 TaxID=3345661 RepID=UPI0035E1F737
MAITLYNGAEVPTNSDPYELTSDLAKMALSLNLPIPVDNAAQRDGLAALAGGTLKIGTTVLRKDQSMFTEKWDGTSWKTTGHSEWTRTGQVVPTNDVWGVGALTLDAAKTTDTAFITHPAADVLRFRDAGTYAVTFNPESTTGTLNTLAYAEIITGGETYRTGMTGQDRVTAAHPNLRVAANQDALFVIYHESGSNRTLKFRIAITRIG